VVKAAIAEKKEFEPNYGYLPDLIGHLVGLAHIKASTLCSEALSNLELTPKQAVTLHFIAENSDTMQKDLALGVGTSPTVMVSILDTLSTRGFIKRISSKQDRRSLTVIITPEGKKALPLVKKALFATEDQLDEEAQLTATERQDLVKLLRKLTKRQVKT